ncbi:MAG: MBL fold metallo-hydrolase [Kofleriaceae bacterium]|nr:MBL fold metallo-hydrolase [Myxococcales bacterium]MCB9563185.1 MBL fold metallo-hydrolase [Kofleriaceae bacterium]MCB9573632.1 MBL fold metallo-hydrolase [Kofleriaceae bacterium]
MTVHHISCGTMCPITVGRMVCHCLVVETDAGLVLVETGLGTADVAEASRRLRRSWRLLARPGLDVADTAVRQLAALGFAPDDVRHIVVTHLDLDHAGGIPDFPRATVHVHRRELAAATARATRKARNRYVPAHLADPARWRTYEETGERWFGFDSVRALGDTDPEIVLVPLPGHTEGHTAVAVRDGARWLLHCGDAYFHRNTLVGARAPLALAWFERRMETEAAPRRRNAARLAELARDHGDEIVIFNAHDAAQFDEARGRAAG